MNRSIRIAAAALFALPLIASAQTTVPADQPRTNLEKQQTEQQGNATKYGQSGTSSATGNQMNHKDASSMSKDSMSKDGMSKSSKKGTTSKTSDDTSTSTSTPTNTVTPTTTK